MIWSGSDTVVRAWHKVYQNKACLKELWFGMIWMVHIILHTILSALTFAIDGSGQRRDLLQLSHFHTLGLWHMHLAGLTMYRCPWLPASLHWDLFPYDAGLVGVNVVMYCSSWLPISLRWGLFAYEVLVSSGRADSSSLASDGGLFRFLVTYRWLHA